MSEELIQQLRMANVSLDITSRCLDELNLEIRTMNSNHRLAQDKWIELIADVARQQKSAQKIGAFVVIFGVTVVASVVSVLINLIM